MQNKGVVAGYCKSRKLQATGLQGAPRPSLCTEDHRSNPPGRCRTWPPDLRAGSWVPSHTLASGPWAEIRVTETVPASQKEQQGRQDKYTKQSVNEVTARLQVLYPDVIRHTLYHTIRDKSEVHHSDHKEHPHRSRRKRVLSKRALGAMRPKMSLGGASFSRRPSRLLLSLPCSCCGLSPCQPTPYATLRHNVPLLRNLDSTHSGIQLQEDRTGPGTKRDLGSVFSHTSHQDFSVTNVPVCAASANTFSLSSYTTLKYRLGQPPQTGLPFTRQSCFFIHCPTGASWNPLLQVLET